MLAVFLLPVVRVITSIVLRFSSTEHLTGLLATRIVTLFYKAILISLISISIFALIKLLTFPGENTLIRAGVIVVGRLIPGSILVLFLDVIVNVQVSAVLGPVFEISSDLCPDLRVLEYWLAVLPITILLENCAFILIRDAFVVADFNMRAFLLIELFTCSSDTGPIAFVRGSV